MFEDLRNFFKQNRKKITVCFCSVLVLLVMLGILASCQGLVNANGDSNAIVINKEAGIV